MSGRILIVAGEASGDLHGAALVSELRKRAPDVHIRGIGGAHMRAAGVETEIDAASLSVMGFSEVVGALKRVYGAFRRMKHSLDEFRPDVLILIDYPELNLPLAAQAYKRSIPVVYFISPQVWAWRRGRVRKIARTVTRMLVIFPFEETFYRKHGVDARFVGHPLIPRIDLGITPERARMSLGLDPDALCVGILPGSRKSEIRYMLPVMLEAAGRVAREYPRAVFVLPLAHTLERSFVEDFLRQSEVPVLLEPNFETAVRSCSAAMVTSGTATLHTALLDVPMVIGYRTSRLSYLIGRSVVRVDFIGIVNLIAGRRVVPELVQDEVTPDNLAAACLELLRDRGVRDGILTAYNEIRTGLGKSNAAQTAAEAVLDVMKTRERQTG